MADKAVVLLSGGQDSTTCLMWALDRFGGNNLWLLSFDYEQRHGAAELHAAIEIANYYELGDRHYVMDVPQLSTLGAAALTNQDIDVNVNAQGTGNVYAEEHGLPSTFVPGRNLLFFTLAAAYGAKVGANQLVTGVCSTDRAGYPDCRTEFVATMEATTQIALDDPAFRIHAPLLFLSKGETFQLANDLGGLDVIIEKTHTCYRGIRNREYTWGVGCGECGACQERARGWQDFTLTSQR